MRFIFIILLFLFSNPILANQDNNEEVEVIDLYQSKSLDQMVLENLNNENDQEEFEELSENSNEIQIKTNDVEVKQIEIVKDNFIYKNKIKDLKNYFNNLQKINSKTLQNQII